MIIKITGMTCSHCVHAVKTALAKVSGVKGIKEIRIDDGITVIEGTPNTQDVISAVRDAGYSAMVI
ncbi:MAG: heavy-metal-associated domain-containing protein [Nitrospiraceae bacterium]